MLFAELTPPTSCRASELPAHLQLIHGAIFIYLTPTTTEWGKCHPCVNATAPSGVRELLHDADIDNDVNYTALMELMTRRQDTGLQAMPEHGRYRLTFGTGATESRRRNPERRRGFREAGRHGHIVTEY